MFFVRYHYCGDAEGEEFSDLESALRFMNKEINSENYGEFVLYRQIPFSISIAL